VAILDDDPAKRRLRIHGIPVLGGRGQIAAKRRVRDREAQDAEAELSARPRPHAASR